MSDTQRPNWQKLSDELKTRWVIFAILGAYLLAGALFAVLIYRFHWDQPATHWTVRVFPLPAALVNGEPIWLSTLDRRLEIIAQYADRVASEQPDLLPDDPEELKSKTLEQLIDFALIRQEAKKVGITVTAKEVTTTFDKSVKESGGLDAFTKVLAEFYGLTPYQFSKEYVPAQLYREKLQTQLFTQLKVRHIVLKDRAQAEQVLERVKKGEDFSELAKQFSQDLTSREQGGDLGTIERGSLDKPFEDAAFGLKAGEFTKDLVETKFGFHIIKVDERKDGPISDKSFTDWLADVKKAAKIRRFVTKEAPAGGASTPALAPK